MVEAHCHHRHPLVEARRRHLAEAPYRHHQKVGVKWKPPNLYAEEGNK